MYHRRLPDGGRRRRAGGCDHALCGRYRRERANAPISAVRYQPTRFHAWPGTMPLLEMERTNAPVIAGRAGDRLTAGLQAIIDKHALPFVAYQPGFHLSTWKPPA